MKKANTCYFMVIIISMFTASSYSQEQEISSVELKLISGDLYEILGGRGAGGGAYIGDNGVLVIDAKMDQASVEQTIQGITKITDKPIKYLINTHSDGDHVWGNQFFPEQVTIIAHEKCRKEFFHPNRNGDPSDWNDPDLAPFLPSVTFRDKLDIYLGSKKVELWYFGVGHTTGDLVVYIPDEKTAFLGDQFFIDRPQLIHDYKGGNSFEYVKTVKKMMETLDAEKFCSGHSEIVDRAAIESHVGLMEKRHEKVKSLVADGKSLEEIKQEFEEDEARLVEVIFSELKSR